MHELQGASHSSFAANRESPENGAPQKHGIGTKRKCLDDVCPAPEVGPVVPSNDPRTA